MLDLEYIDPQSLNDNWEMIREGLAKVANVGEGWIPEQVYMAIMQGNAHLHIGYVGNAYAGFIITQTTSSFVGTSLHVWAVYSGLNDFDLLKDSMPILNEWANNIKAKKITFSSKRKGWQKMAKRLGFKPSVTFYEIEV